MIRLATRYTSSKPAHHHKTTTYHHSLLPSPVPLPSPLSPPISNPAPIPVSPFITLAHKRWCSTTMRYTNPRLLYFTYLLHPPVHQCSYCHLLMVLTIQWPSVIPGHLVRFCLLLGNICCHSNKSSIRQIQPPAASDAVTLAMLRHLLNCGIITIAADTFVFLR